MSERDILWFAAGMIFGTLNMAWMLYVLLVGPPWPFRRRRPRSENVRSAPRADGT